MNEELKPCKCGKQYMPEYYPSHPVAGQRFSIVCLKCKISIVNNMQGLIEQWNGSINE